MRGAQAGGAEVNLDDTGRSPPRGIAGAIGPRSPSRLICSLAHFFFFFFVRNVDVPFEVTLSR